MPLIALVGVGLGDAQIARLYVGGAVSCCGVIFMPFEARLIPLAGGRVLAEGRLADEGSLNALSHEMARGALAALREWRDDPAVAAVLLRGGGERHFCAGGNIRNMAAMIRARDWDNISAFFCDEYRLDAMLYAYPKPVIGWATGAVMGGGMGVFQGCGLRLVSDRIKMAMPEVHIGLFADVGAGWFLRRCPPPLGLFLGLSGATIDSADALYANLADMLLPADSLEGFVDALAGAEWGDDADGNMAMIRRAAAGCSVAGDEVAAGSALAAALPEIVACCRGGSAAEIVAALAGAEHEWLRGMSARLAGASAGAIVFWHNYWHALAGATMPEVFAADYRAVMAFCRDADGEFLEGVRALLIDKDKSPAWRFAACADVPAEWPGYDAADDAVAEALAVEIGAM